MIPKLKSSGRSSIFTTPPVLKKIRRCRLGSSTVMSSRQSAFECGPFNLFDENDERIHTIDANTAVLDDALELFFLLFSRCCLLGQSLFHLVVFAVHYRAP